MFPSKSFSMARDGMSAGELMDFQHYNVMMHVDTPLSTTILHMIDPS